MSIRIPMWEIHIENCWSLDLHFDMVHIPMENWRENPHEIPYGFHMILA